MAAGREIHLRNMEVLGLYPANSLFLEGYLNTKGNDRLRTLQMIQDAGFDIESDIPIEDIIEEANHEAVKFIVVMLITYVPFLTLSFF